MKKVAGSIAVIAVLLGTPALAADLARPVYKAPPPPPPAPVYSWTGFYIGGNAGYGWKDQTVTFTPNDPFAQTISCAGAPGTTCPPPTSFSVHGALGGLQAGYNWQVNQIWLLGLEADFDWSNMKGAGSSNFIVLGGFPSNFQASETVRWFGTIRARVGYLPSNKFLLYATGGFAYGRVDENVALNSTLGSGGGLGFSVVCTGVGGPGATNCFVGNSSRTATGFAVGGGGEYVLWNNISVKAEYLYVNLGHGSSVNVVAQVSGGPPFPTPSSFTAAYSTVDFHVVRGGLNWKF